MSLTKSQILASINDINGTDGTLQHELKTLNVAAEDKIQGTM
jgi:hypothetical protein